VKTQEALPSEDAALVLLFSLAVSGQIKLRRIDVWRKSPRCSASTPQWRHDALLIIFAERSVSHEVPSLLVLTVPVGTNFASSCTIFSKIVRTNSNRQGIVPG
jgi:hypothetical protein